MKILTVLALALATAAAAAETPEDFAYAMPIETAGSHAFYEVELPPALYRGVAHADLRDVRVFNAREEVVPHAIRPRGPTSTTTRETIALPFFPLRGEAGRQMDDLHVRVQKRADGTVVDIRSAGKPANVRSLTHGYLIDASQLKQPVQALRFDSKPAREGFSGKVQIDGSDDLARWDTLARDVALLDLEFAGHRLEVKRVELRPRRYKYLRVSWPPGEKQIELTGVRSELVATVSETPRMWLAASAAASGKRPGEHEYDLGGVLPIDRLRIDLPETNTVAQMQILVRDKTSEEWRLAANPLVYRLQRDQSEVTSPEIAINGRGARFVLLRVGQKGGGIGGGTPGIHAGWVPQQLVFAARGEPPFRLAYGAHGAAASALSIASLLPDHATEKRFEVKPAKLGAPVTVAGSKKLRAPIDYRRWVLWASLFIGVAVIGLMAYRLFRQMARGEPAQPPDRRT